jgi:hypothetical protein
LDEIQFGEEEDDGKKEEFNSFNSETKTYYRTDFPKQFRPLYAMIDTILDGITLKFVAGILHTASV